MAYSRKPIIIELTNKLNDLRIEFNASVEKLNELFNASNEFEPQPGSVLVSPTISGASVEASTLNGSTLNSASIVSSTLENSNFNNGTVDNGTIQNSVIESSTTWNSPNLTNPTISGGTLTNSQIDNATLNDPTITNVVLSEPTISGGSYEQGTFTNNEINNPTISGGTINSDELITPSISSSIDGAIWNSGSGLYLQIGGVAERIFSDEYHPNADKLTTARTIDITGDITATAVAFDGTSNIAISASVDNDSHTHDTRYYTETESDSRFVRTDSTTQSVDGIKTFTQIRVPTSQPSS